MEALHALQKNLEDSFSDAQQTPLGTLAERTENYNDNVGKLEEMEDR